MKNSCCCSVEQVIYVRGLYVRELIFVRSIVIGQFKSSSG